MLLLLPKKNWDKNKDKFLQILRLTNNGHCADEIEEKNSTICPSQSSHVGKDCSNKRKSTIFHHTEPKKSRSKFSKWWPHKLPRIESSHSRKTKCGKKDLVEHLREQILADRKRMIVICESRDAIKFAGMAGVGKTLTAKLYAYRYRKEYDHILWIDCGEGKIRQSFKMLSMELKVDSLEKYSEVKDLARRSFDKLADSKCLWIYDNAERYQGDGGILKVLPFERKHFHCLITSRSTYWGTIGMGYGKITELPLDNFTEEESLVFLKEKLDTNVIQYTNYQLKELCRLLSNLPLALQLVVIALNNKKIFLENFLENPSVKDLKNIVDAKFDDYEKTINNNFEFHLNMIMENERGNLAKDILKIFGYITPHLVQSKFLLKILNCGINKLNEANKLLKKYSFVTEVIETVIPDDNGEIEEEMSLLSIQRLMQQIIFYNEKGTKKETLNKILNCNGFVGYKLIPFVKYADEDLQKEYPNVLAELLNQNLLMKFLNEMRLQESVILTKFIHGKQNTKKAKFDYASCLDKNGQVEECITILEGLYRDDSEGENEVYNNSFGSKMSEIELNKCLIGGHLLVIHWRMGNKTRVQEILNDNKQLRIIYSKEAWDSAIQIGNSELVNTKYFPSCEDSLINFQLERAT